MEPLDSITLGDDERDELLGVGGTGVLSLSGAPGTSPHSVPVSYGYDPEETTFYFRLAARSDSSKGELESRAVTFVTYRQHDEQWQSVVAKGELEKTTDEEIATQTLEGLQRVEIPYVDIFDEPLSDVPFEFYRLVPEELDGRKEKHSPV